MSASLGMGLARQRSSEIWTHVQKPILVSVAYFIATEAAFFIGTLSDRIFAPFWPPNIVLFCALLVAPPSQWWRFLLAVFPAHVIAEIGVGMAMPQMLVAFATNCAVAATNAYAMQRLVGGAPWLNSLRKAALYVLTTALVSPALWAFGGALVPIFGNSFSNYWTFWAQWYAANALASLTLGPLALILFCTDWQWTRLLPSRHSLEFVLVNICLIVACLLAFQVGSARVASGLQPTILYLPLPLVLWSAARFGGKGVSVSIFIATAVSIWRGLDGPSPFLESDAESNVFALQTFLIGMAAPLILLGAAVDEARHSEMITREAQERMSFAAASANIGLWQLSGGANNDLWTTDYCRAMFGFAPNVPLSWADLLKCVHTEDHDAIARTIDDAKQSGDAATCEFRIVTANGQTLWLTMSAHVERDEIQQPVRISGLFSDITSRKSVETEVELQRRELAHLMRVSMMGELSGALAHELNQPLTAILANAEAARRMLAKGTPILSDIDEALDDIVKDDNRAGEVIRRLHRLLRKGEHKSEPIDFNDLVASTLRLVHSLLISRKIRVQVQLAEDLPTPYGDAIQLQQVFINVIMNAIEAMTSTPPSRRALKIETRLAPEGFAEAVISDQGPGLTEEQRQRIFEPFFTTKDHGLGLGLSICSTIITAHGGQIGIIPNGSHGTTAVISLPVRPATTLAVAV